MSPKNGDVHAPQADQPSPTQDAPIHKPLPSAPPLWLIVLGFITVIQIAKVLRSLVPAVTWVNGVVLLFLGGLTGWAIMASVMRWGPLLRRRHRAPKPPRR